MLNTGTLHTTFSVFSIQSMSIIKTVSNQRPGSPYTVITVKPQGNECVEFDCQ